MRQIREKYANKLITIRKPHSLSIESVCNKFLTMKQRLERRCMGRINLGGKGIKGFSFCPGPCVQWLERKPVCARTRARAHTHKDWDLIPVQGRSAAGLIPTPFGAHARDNQLTYSCHIDVCLSPHLTSLPLSRSLKIKSSGSLPVRVFFFFF